jgi:hypothetical protein
MAVALRLTVGKAEPLLRGQAHFWRCIRALGRDGNAFSASALRAMSDEPRIETVTTYLRRLTSAGVLTVEGSAYNAASRKHERTYLLVRDQETPPALTKDGKLSVRQTSASQAMWNVMRGPLGRNGFTFADLVAWGSTEVAPIAAWTAKSFIQALNAGGYLLQLDPGGGPKRAVWRLRPAMNTGPKPPMILTAKLVYDQNRGKVAGPVIAEEVEP